MTNIHTTCLAPLGWSESFHKSFDMLSSSACEPFRIIRQHGERYVCLGRDGEYAAELSGRLRYETASPSSLPCVGDWVAAGVISAEHKCIINSVLQRQSVFMRKAAGSRIEEQAVAANIDIVFLVCGLDGDFNARRMERYLTVAWESGARPVVLLNKADLCENADAYAVEMELVACNAPVHLVSAIRGDGLEAIASYLKPGVTAALLGSSGAGKSTITNALLGEERILTQAVREDDSRGRHTTTHRELHVLPQGGLLIDTPGMRELQFWADDSSLDNAFEDIALLAEQCRFRDCSHDSEPGCAVQEALQSGALEKGRYKSYQKLKRELAHMARKENKPAQLLEREKWKQIHKEARRMMKARDRM